MVTREASVLVCLKYESTKFPKKNTQIPDGSVAGKPGHRCGNLAKPLRSFLSRSKLGHLDCFPIAQIKKYIRMVLVWHMSLIRRNQYGIILFLWLFLMLCLFTGLKDVTVSIKKLQSSCAAFQSIFRKIGTVGIGTTVGIAGHTCVRNFGTRPRPMPRVRLSQRALIVQKLNPASLGCWLQCLAMNLPISCPTCLFI